MKTISFKIETNTQLQKVISEDSRICSSIYRFAFNRFQDHLTSSQNYNVIAKTFKDINCHLRNSALRAANGLYKLNKNKKVYFGNFLKFKKGLITKDELKDSRDMGIMSEGEFNQKGNRLFQIKVEENKFVYKRKQKQHYDLKIIEKLSDKRKQVLEKIQLLMSEKKIPVTIRLKKDHIYLSYDEKVVEKEKQFKRLFKNRVLGIDLNPNYFGISIIEFNHQDKYRVIHKEVIDLNELQKKSKNKIYHELYEINHHILKLCKTWKVSKLAIEDLKFKKSNKFWSKNLNRLCRNKFRYSFVKSHLTILCNVYGVELIEVNAAYSSIIGNFKHGSSQCPDMVAASIEIARRAYKKFEKGWFQPDFVSKSRLQQVLGNQWKKELELGYSCWKKLAGIIKKSKLKYRFQLQPLNAVFSKTYINSCISVYNY